MANGNTLQDYRKGKINETDLMSTASLPNHPHPTVDHLLPSYNSHSKSLKDKEDGYFTSLS